jgi:hypothetical protein
MNKAVEYRQCAIHCRTLANNTPTHEHRAQFMKIADAWDRLATERELRVPSERIHKNGGGVRRLD